MGGDASYSPRLCRDRQGPALDTARLLVGSDRLDRMGNGAGSRPSDDETLRSRSVKGQGTSADLAILLRAYHYFGVYFVCPRRLDDGRLGRRRTRCIRLAHDLVRQLSFAPLRQPAALDIGRLDQQLVRRNS